MTVHRTYLIQKFRRFATSVLANAVLLALVTALTACSGSDDSTPTSPLPSPTNTPTTINPTVAVTSSNTPTVAVADTPTPSNTPTTVAVADTPTPSNTPTTVAVADTPTPSNTPTTVAVADTPAPSNTPTPSLADQIQIIPATAIASANGSEEDASPLDASTPDGILEYDINAPILIPDPVIYNTDNQFLFKETYSGLTRISDDGSVEPDLVETFSVSDDGLEYTFTLRKDLKFSDGTPLDAADVKWSWERALKPQTNSRDAARILGNILGAEDVRNGDRQELEGVQIIDQATLKVRLHKPAAHFTALLADPVASVLKPENVQNWGVQWGNFHNMRFTMGRDTFEELPVGTGPFQIAEFNYIAGFNSLEIRAILEPNPHYWDNIPDFQAVRYTDWERAYLERAVESGAETYTFDHNLLDIGQIGNDQGARVLSTGASLIGRGKVVFSDTPPEVTFLAFNTAVPPFDDLHFRRAIVAAANHGSIDFFIHTLSPFDVADSLIPPSLPGHSPENTVQTPNREIAQAELQMSNYAESPESVSINYLAEDLVAMIPSDFDTFTQNWRNWLGLDPVHGPENSRELIVSAFRNALRDGSLQMRLMRFIPEYHDPHAILGTFSGIFGDNAQSEETLRLDAMLDAAAAEPDAVIRLDMYRDIERHILDRALALPIFWREPGTYSVVKEWIHGYRIPRYGGSRFKDVTIDTSNHAYPIDRSLD